MPEARNHNHLGLILSSQNWGGHSTLSARPQWYGTFLANHEIYARSGEGAMVDASTPALRKALTHTSAFARECRQHSKRSAEPRLSQAYRITRSRSRNRTEPLTALLHHVNPDVLRTGFFSLKKAAAPGIDGVTWQRYAEDRRAISSTSTLACVEQRAAATTAAFMNFVIRTRSLRGLVSSRRAARRLTCRLGDLHGTRHRTLRRADGRG